MTAALASNYLTGKIEFDGKKIADDAKWTEDQVNDAVTKSGAMNWSRSDTKASFESLMGDESTPRSQWFYAGDDELAMGILRPSTAAASPTLPRTRSLPQAVHHRLRRRP